ncbi:hypothetical protein [Engelhardtia mirabilis]|uniref:Invasion gene expression up-regulator, SirB n=1 Tax=Engelhardtia mirabilis TaxID=2528011 RepID=A0A518BEP2_9BACT|nr:hypothetical protein Pla133_04910 [Planctomycetes bacterium Pla133]QDU99752.1 hypothetical protein Pla86_04910 [Planctomycetes bacterium Pla86]
MPATFYHFIHVTSLLLLAGVTFAAIANPAPERRKKALMLSGLLGVIALVGGFGLVSKALGGEWQTWVFVKIGCWLLLAGMTGLIFRRPEAGRLWGTIAVILIAVAVFCVYYRPFMGSV